MEGQDVKSSVAVIDNGKFGKREIKFETGRLAKQAAGSAAVYLDGETMLFSATTASKTPKDQFDFFPLTLLTNRKTGRAGQLGVILLSVFRPRCTTSQILAPME